MYTSEDDMLMLSGIQHFMFCPRQWALIHIEQRWSENRLTAEGQLLHERVDDPKVRQKNGDVITLRGVPLVSHELGLYGIADAIELKPAPAGSVGITHRRYAGLWLPYPVEYKHGHSKISDCDRVQLSAQAMCLEEMYGISISLGAIFYWQTKHREVVELDAALRQKTLKLAKQMHEVFHKGMTPAAVKCPHCRSCSLIDECLPQLSQRWTVKNYLKRRLYEEDA